MTSASRRHGTDGSRRAALCHNVSSFTTKYERMRLASYEKQDLELDYIWHMRHTMYVNNYPRPSNPKPVASHGTPVQVAGHNSRRCSVTTTRASDTSYKTVPFLRRRNTRMRLITTSNINGNNTRHKTRSG